MTATTQDKYVLGIDIGGTNLRLALADSNAAILNTWSRNLQQSPDPASVVALICEGAQSLLQEAGLPPSSLIACAAGAPGITDTDRGVVLATSYLLGWRNVPLQALLEEALNIPAAIDNDVNIAALGEFHATEHDKHKDARNFVFLAIGTGIGAGILLNGQLHRGETFSAGEIGYMLVPGVSEIPAAEDEPGALESRIGGTGLRNQWRTLWNPSQTRLPIDAAPTEIFAEAATGAPLATQLLDSSARILAYAIYNIALVLNCRLFVLGGGAGMHPAFLTSVQQHVNARNPYAPITVLASTLGPAAQLAGAVHLALETAARHQSK
ncbi:MAG TPA: ROK family protein [Acidobacteriaceae bacterium]|nr:ROK family protein [Acidobacteriaceae bacterium]